MDTNTPPLKCSKAHCKTLIPAGGQFKQCTPCRNRQKDLSKTYRDRRRAATTTEAITSTGKKRTREDGPCDEEQPPRRLRLDTPANVPENAHVVDDDESDDPQYGESVKEVCQLPTYTEHKLITHLISVANRLC
jgi:hypothetical protein